MLTYPLSESGMAVRNQPLPSSAGQVCTGPAIFNQLDLFLPPCPITSRYNVIPAGYNERLHADSSPQILSNQAAARMRSLLTKQGLRKTKSIDGSPRQSLRWLQIRPCRMLFRPIRSRSPRPCDAVSGSRRFNEVTMAMSFLAGWIEPPHAGLNSNLTNRITVTFRTYNPEE